MEVVLQTPEGLRSPVPATQPSRQSDLGVWRAFLESLVFPLKGRTLIAALSIPVLILPAFSAVFGEKLDGPDLIPYFCFFVPLAVVTAWLGLTNLLTAATLGPRARLRPFSSGHPRIAVNFLCMVVVPTAIPVAIISRPPLYPILPITVLTNPVLLTYLVVLYPMSLGLAAGPGRLVKSLNPVALIRSIWCLRCEYGAVVLFIAALSAATIAFARGLIRAGPPIAYVIPHIAYYSVSIVLSRIGFLVYRHRDWLGR